MKQMTHLSKPQAKVLGMGRFAIAITHCCALSTVAVFLAELFRKTREHNQREIETMVSPHHVVLKLNKRLKAELKYSCIS